MMTNNYDNQFTGIVQTHSSILFFVAYRITKNRMVSEDIVQEAFLRLWKHRVSVFPGNPGGWLHKVVCNLGYRHLKRTAVEEQLLDQLRTGATACSQDAEEQLIKKENDELFHHLVSRMPHKQQVVYHLSREEGLRRNEIATQLNLSPNTVKVHLLRAVQFMKEHIACFILFLLFFAFNNLIFKNSNTKTRSGYLHSIKQIIDKHSHDQTPHPDAPVTSVAGKMITLKIVSLIKL
jgi:RNA polymerase sigma factor (sigma-70 family)